MAATANQTIILNLVVGMFDAAPGATYLAEFEATLASAGSINDLAAALGATATFEGLYPASATNTAFATSFIDNLVGTEADAAAKAWAVSWIEALLNAGASRTDVIVTAVTELAALDASDATWGNAQKALANQVDAAEIYSIEQGNSAADLATLQAVTANVTSDPATVPATATQTIILYLIVGMFDAAPGATFLAEFEATLASAGSINGLAAALGATATFEGLYPASATNNAFATSFIDNLVGIEADTAAKAWAVSWIEALLNAGASRTDVIVTAVTELAALDATDATWGNAQKALANQVDAAEFYSIEQGNSAADLATLQAVTASVTSDPATVPVATTFALTGAASVAEGNSATYTVTANQAVTVDTVVTFSVVAGDVAAANQGTSNTNLNDFAGGSFNPTTVTILAGQTTATFTVAAADDSVIELPENYLVTATVVGETGTMTATTSLLDSTGKIFALTTGIDTIVGSANDDTINGTELTLTGLDSINGGAGTDTLVLNDITDAGLDLSVATITNVETLNLRSSAELDSDDGGTAIDTTGITGLTTLNALQSTDVTLTAAATTNVNVTGATGAIVVKGGKDVTVTDATAWKSISIGDATGTTGSPTGAITVIDTDNSYASDISITGGTDVTVTTTADASNGNIVVGHATNGVASGAVVITQNSTSDGSALVTTGLITVTGGTTVDVTTYSTSVGADSASNADIDAGRITVTADDHTTAVTVTQNDSATTFTKAAVAVLKETSVVTFGVIKSGEVLTINGLSFTASKDLTAVESAQAFAGIVEGGTTGSASVANGVYSGTFNTAVWSSAAAVDAVVTFTAQDDAEADLSFTGTAATNDGAARIPTQVKAAGTAAVAEVVSTNVIDNGALTINDNATAASITTITADGYVAVSTIGGVNATTALTTLNLANAGAGVDMVVADTAATLALSLDSMGASTDTDEAVVTLTAAPATLNITNTGASYVDLTANATTALTVEGSSALNLSNSTLTALETLTVSGAVGLTADVSASASLTAVSTVATTGDSTITLNGQNATFTGGIGADDLTLSTTAPTETIDLGEGDDSITLAAGTTVLGTNGAISGGNGVDTLVMAAADAEAASANNTFEGTIDGFEKLSLGWVASGKSNTIDLANLDGISHVVSAGTAVSAIAIAEIFTADFNGSGLIVGSDTIAFDGDTITLTGGETPAQIAAAVAGGTYAFYNAVANGDGTVTFTAHSVGKTTDALAADFTIVDVGAHGVLPAVTVNVDTQGTSTITDGTLTLENMADAGTLELTESGNSATVTMTDATGGADSLNVVITNAADTHFGTLLVDDVETLNITATDTVQSGTNTIETFTLAANGDSVEMVTLEGAANLTLTTNSVVLTNVNATDMTGNLMLSTNGIVAQTVTGGTGDDTLTAAGTSDVLLGGEGDDTLVAGDLAQLTGGAGADTFDMTNVTTNVNSYATVVDAIAGDIIETSGVAFNAGITIANTVVFQDYANAAINVNDADNTLSWFQFSGNTYVVQDVDNSDTDFTNGADIVIQLTGLVDLSAASFNATLGTIEIA